MLEVTEIKTVPYVPISIHLWSALWEPYVENACRTLFWTTADLETKLLAFRDYFNGYRCHAGLQGRLPEPGVDGRKKLVSFISYRWRKHCRGLYQTPIETPESIGANLKYYRWQTHCRGLFQTPIAA